MREGERGERQNTSFNFGCDVLKTSKLRMKQRDLALNFLMTDPVATNSLIGSAVIRLSSVIRLKLSGFTVYLWDLIKLGEC